MPVHIPVSRHRQLDDRKGLRRELALVAGARPVVGNDEGHVNADGRQRPLAGAMSRVAALVVDAQDSHDPSLLTAERATLD